MHVRIRFIKVNFGRERFSWRNELQGFEVAGAKRGLGLRSLMGRVKGVGGDVRIECSDEGATRIQIELPLAA